MDYVMPSGVAVDLQAQALACIGTLLTHDEEGFNAAAGTDADRAILLPVVIMELASVLEGLVGRNTLLQQVGNVLDEHARRMSERN